MADKAGHAQRYATGRAAGGAPRRRSRRLIAEALVAPNMALKDTDLLVVAHKAVSKAEGRIRLLAEIAPGQRALALAASSARIPATFRPCSTSQPSPEGGARVMVCVTHHGFVCANAGVDGSNVPRPTRWCSCPVIPMARRAPCAAVWAS